MLLFASYHYSERTRVTDWWRKTPDKSFLSTSVFVAFLLSYSLTLRQLRSYSLTWGSCSYSVTSNNRKRLLKIAQCEPGFNHQRLLKPVFLVQKCSIYWINNIYDKYIYMYMYMCVYCINCNCNCLYRYTMFNIVLYYFIYFNSNIMYSMYIYESEVKWHDQYGDPYSEFVLCI